MFPDLQLCSNNDAVYEYASVHTPTPYAAAYRQSKHAV